MTPQERQELDRILAAPTKAPEYQPPEDFGAWLLEVSPAFSWYWAHLVLVRTYLERVRRGLERRLGIFLPPRHGKSEQVTVRWPVYLLEHDPTQRYIVGAYSQALAKRFTRKSRNIATAHGVLQLAPDVQSAHEWETVQEGGMFGAGVGVGVTGRGANGIVIDDPVKSRKEAESPAYQEWVWDWYRDDLYTRLEPGGWVVLQMTRWHLHDLGGRLLDPEWNEGDPFTVLNLPALAEANDPLGRQPDQALCPERYPREELIRIRNMLGRSFEALYQQRPTPAEGQIILAAWFRYYDQQEAEYDAVVQSWDCANKDKELAAYSVCTTWGLKRQAGGYGYDLLHVLRLRLNYPDLRRHAVQLAERHDPVAVLIEDKGNGTALLQDLRASTGVPVVAIEPTGGDKGMRLAAESVAYEAGKVRHPRRRDARWIGAFEGELLAAPDAPYMDQVDSTSQFLAWARGYEARVFVHSAGPSVAAGLYDEPGRRGNPYGMGSRADLGGF